MCKEVQNTANRTIIKKVRLTPAEAADLKAKAEAVGVNQSTLLRMLLKGYRPKEKPDADFYTVMRELHSIGNNINQLAAKANSQGWVDAPMLEQEQRRWSKFILAVEERYLRPERDDKWR